MRYNLTCELCVSQKNQQIRITIIGKCPKNTKNYENSNLVSKLKYRHLIFNWQLRPQSILSEYANSWFEETTLKVTQLRQKSEKPVIFHGNRFF